MAGWLVIIACALYGAALFAAAWLAGRERFEAPVTRHYATLYALALAVYCTSWTFFGAVAVRAIHGTSTNNGHRRENKASLSSYLGDFVAR